MSLDLIFLVGVVAMITWGYLFDIGKALRRIADALEKKRDDGTDD